MRSPGVVVVPVCILLPLGAALALARGGAVPVVGADPAQPTQVELVTVATGFNNPIGIDYHEPSDRVALSVNYPTGRPHNLELVAADGRAERFSIAAGWQDELKIATIREGPCTNGFEPGDLFTGTGRPGAIARIAADGTRVWSRWVQLVGDGGLMRGALFHDRYCVAGGNLIVVTTEGGVWSIDADGRATRLARLNTHLEGVTTVPDDPARYGPWAGKILVGAEDQRRVYAVGTDRSVEHWSLGIAPEDIDVVAAGEHFYGVDFAARRIVRADASQWQDKLGDVVIAQESGALFDVRWKEDTDTFEVTRIATVSQWEHVTFAPVALRAPTPTPSNTPTTTATDTPAPTSTPAPTATATRTPSPAPTTPPRPIYLPIILGQLCTPQHVDVALVLDASTSMLERAASGRTKMAEAKAAARLFLRQLDLPGDRAAIAWFNETARVEQDLTDDRDALEAALARIDNREFTRIDLGVSRGLDALRPALSDRGRHPALVLLTDGRSNPVPGQLAIEAANTARAAGVTLFSIGLGDDVDTATLRGIAGADRRLFLTPDAGDLARIYALIAADLACIEEPSWP